MSWVRTDSDHPGHVCPGVQEGPWKAGEDGPGPGKQVFEVHVRFLVGNSFLPSLRSFPVASGTLLLSTVGCHLIPTKLFISSL